jgi:hypothetical protein
MVDSYTRRGQYFDMESLGYVVLASWRHDLRRAGPVKLADPFKPDAIWLTMRVTDGEVGVRLISESPPEPPPALVRLEVEIERPPGLSVRGTTIPELRDCAELDEASWLGLELRFGPNVDIAEFGFQGPIKPLIDAMGPVLGLDRRGGPADHRLHDLRIRHDPDRGEGVIARLWYVQG